MTRTTVHSSQKRPQYGPCNKVLLDRDELCRGGRFRPSSCTASDRTILRKHGGKIFPKNAVEKLGVKRLFGQNFQRPQSERGRQCNRKRLYGIRSTAYRSIRRMVHRVLMGKLFGIHGIFYRIGNMQVMTFSRRYSSSRSPYDLLWMTRILLLKPSTNPNATLFSGLQ